MGRCPGLLRVAGHRAQLFTNGSQSRGHALLLGVGLAVDVVAQFGHQVPGLFLGLVSHLLRLALGRLRNMLAGLDPLASYFLGFGLGRLVLGWPVVGGVVGGGTAAPPAG